MPTGGHKLIAVRVYFKNPIERKSATMKMTENALSWERSILRTPASPYTKIVRIRG